MAHELPELGFEYDELEPYMDEKTMRLHHSKHHAGYVKKLNAAIEGTEFENLSIEELIKKLDKVPEKIKTAVRNNGGGHLNHSFYWKVLKKNAEIPSEIEKAINEKWEEFCNFKDDFIHAATTLFGSGWVWLVVNEKKELEIIQTSNQDNPITKGLTPILAIDLWEHQYYLLYNNRRPDFVEAFFYCINWEQVNEYYLKAIK